MCATIHPSLFSCSNELAPLLVAFFSFPFTSFVLSSTGAGLILWIRPTFCAQMAFLTAVPTNNVLVWIRTLVLLLATFLDAFPFLPFLPLVPPLRKLSTSIGSEVLFVAIVMSANWLRRAFNVGLDFASKLLVRDQSCTVHGKILFQLTRNKGFECSLSSSRAVVVAPLDLLFSYRRTSSSYFSSPVGRSCKLHRSGINIICNGALRFPLPRGTQRRTNRLNASRPDVAAPRTKSKLALSVNARCAK